MFYAVLPLDCIIQTFDDLIQEGLALPRLAYWHFILCKFSVAVGQTWSISVISFLCINCQPVQPDEHVHQIASVTSVAGVYRRL